MVDVKPAFSARTDWDLEETPYARAVHELRSSGRRFCDLTISNPTTCGFDFSTEILDPLMERQLLTYDPDPKGLLQSRQAVAQYYSSHSALVGPEQVVLTTSTSESYSYLFRLLCDAGDEVLIAQPSYPLFDFLARLDDVRLKPYPLFYDHGWWIDFGELEQKITARTRALIVVHPNNPTGHWTSAAERVRLEKLCLRHGLALIIDEVFLDYGLDEVRGEAMSFTAGEHPVLTFCLSGLSKVCGLPQMKAAWIAALGPEEPRVQALARLEVIADTFLSLSAPIQRAIPDWLSARRAIQAQISERLQQNLRVLRSAAEMHPQRLRLFTPEAGWSAVLSLPACGGSVDCAERLIRDHGVVLHPGAFYGMSEPNRVVVSLLTPAKTFAAGVRAIVGA